MECRPVSTPVRTISLTTWRSIMTITRFTPFQDVAVLQNRLNSIFQDFARTGTDNEPLTTGNFVPAVDIYVTQQVKT